jgi:hypothetical protein
MIWCDGEFYARPTYKMSHPHGSGFAPDFKLPGMPRHVDLPPLPDVPGNERPGAGGLPSWKLEDALLPFHAALPRSPADANAAFQPIAAIAGAEGKLKVEVSPDARWSPAVSDLPQSLRYHNRTAGLLKAASEWLAADTMQPVRDPLWRFNVAPPAEARDAATVARQTMEDLRVPPALKIPRLEIACLCVGPTAIPVNEPSSDAQKIEIPKPNFAKLATTESWLDHVWDASLNAWSRGVEATVAHASDLPKSTRVY